ncbi:MAG: protein-glutamate O-methyltransferase CheR [Phycisphaerales bacterium]
MTTLPGPSAPAVAYERLKTHVLGTTGLAYFHDRDEELESRFRRRMTATACDSHEAYLALLLDVDTGDEELQQLVRLLTVGETYFFRHDEAFSELRTRIIPDIIRSGETRRSIRIWSAACSIGAEAYSIAITLAEHFPNIVRDWDVSILATDINEDYLQTARRGEYEAWALRSVPDEAREAYFERVGARWRVRERYRRLVTFSRHNLVRDEAPTPFDGGGFDLIFCRNVVIYFSAEIVMDLAPRLHAALRDGGWFIVGPAEAGCRAFERFSVVSAPGVVLYQKSDVAARQIPDAASRLDACTPAPPPTPVRPTRGDARRKHTPVPEEKPAEDRMKALIGAGRLEQSLAACEDALRGSRYNAALHLTHALLLQQSGDVKRAESAFRRALFLNRRLVMAQIGLATTLEACGRRREAARMYTGVLRLLEGCPDGDEVEHADGATVHDLRIVAQRRLAGRIAE